MVSFWIQIGRARKANDTLLLRDNENSVSECDDGSYRKLRSVLIKLCIHYVFRQRNTIEFVNGKIA